MERLLRRRRFLVFQPLERGERRQCGAERIDASPRARDRTVDAFGAVDVLVNNAAIIKGIDFLEISEADFDAVLSVNLRGAFLMAQAVARQMVAQVKAGRRPGSVINMSSVNAVFAIANQVPYSVSKGGLNQLTKVMALSLAEYGISDARRIADALDILELYSILERRGEEYRFRLAQLPRLVREFDGLDWQLDLVVDDLKRQAWS